MADGDQTTVLYLASLHDQNKSGFFPTNQGFLKTSNCSDWLDKSRPSKKATFVLIM